MSDRVAVLSLNRDDVRNELTGTALIDDICATVDWINGSAAVSVLVVTGAAGGNVRDMRERKVALLVTSMKCRITTAAASNESP